jgi:ATP-dependent Clp protease ATP-binding subunit ClpA
MKNEMSKTKEFNEKTVLLDPERKSPRAKEFEDKLLSRIVGQERAVRRMSGLFQIYLAGNEQPVSSRRHDALPRTDRFGKNARRRSGGGVLFGEPHAVVKIDCAEFQHSHEIAKLIGSPPDIWDTAKPRQC